MAAKDEKSSRTPERSEGTVANEKTTLTALERWLRSSPRARKLTRAVRDAQAALRESASDEVWQLYLVLEERINARHAEIVAMALQLTRRAPRTKRARSG